LLLWLLSGLLDVEEVVIVTWVLGKLEDEEAEAEAEKVAVDVVDVVDVTADAGEGGVHTVRASVDEGIDTVCATGAFACE
jgi:ribosomal protein S2